MFDSMCVRVHAFRLATKALLGVSLKKFVDSQQKSRQIDRSRGCLTQRKSRPLNHRGTHFDLLFTIYLPKFKAICFICPAVPESERERMKGQLVQLLHFSQQLCYGSTVRETLHLKFRLNGWAKL